MGELPCRGRGRPGKLRLGRVCTPTAHSLALILRVRFKGSLMLIGSDGYRLLGQLEVGPYYCKNLLIDLTLRALLSYGSARLNGTAVLASFFLIEMARCGSVVHLQWSAYQPPSDAWTPKESSRLSGQ
jgi:hypothetical protein